MQLTITFQVEPADRSVGIMAEGFSAWEETGDSWCDLVSCGPEWKFQWFSNETGNEVPPPRNATMVQALLQLYVDTWYQLEADEMERRFPEEDKE